MKSEFVTKLPEFKFNTNLIKAEYDSHIFSRLRGISNVNGVTFHSYYTLLGITGWKLNSEIPYIKEVITSLRKIFYFRDATFRVIHPNCNYSWHTDHGDQSTNWHIPIQTSAGCLFVFSDKVYEMPADGSVYQVTNINNFHTFVNAGKPERDRIHLVLERNF